MCYPFLLVHIASFWLTGTFLTWTALPVTIPFTPYSWQKYNARWGWGWFWVPSGSSTPSKQTVHASYNRCFGRDLYNLLHQRVHFSPPSFSLFDNHGDKDSCDRNHFHVIWYFLVHFCSRTIATCHMIKNVRTGFAFRYCSLEKKGCIILGFLRNKFNEGDHVFELLIPMVNVRMHRMLLVLLLFDYNPQQ